MPISIKYTFTPVRLDEGIVLSNLLRAANRWWDACIMAWSEEIIAGIHVDTGMSASSLKPLVDEVGEPGAGRLIVGHRTRQGVTDMEGGWHPELIKGPELGAEWGADAYIIDRGSIARMILSFEYNIRIYQWSRWENLWQTAEAGAAAFDAQAQTQKYLDNIFKPLT